MAIVPWLVGAFVVFVLGMQLAVWLGSRRMRGRPAPALDAFLDPAQRDRERLLFYFFSERCGPCRAMTPVIDELRAERDDVVKVDVAVDSSLAAAFGVRATPTVVLVEHGVVREVLLGGQSRARLEKLLDSPLTAD